MIKRFLLFFIISLNICCQDSSLVKILLLATPRIEYTQENIAKQVKAVSELRDKVRSKYTKYLNASIVALEMIKKSDDPEAFKEINRIIAKRKELQKEIDKLKMELDASSSSPSINDIYFLRDRMNNLVNEQEEINVFMDKAVKKYSPKYYALGLYPDMKDIIEVITSLLTLKSFLFANYHAFLYRFIQLYPVFVILDEVKPNKKMLSILNEMIFHGRNLEKMLPKEEPVVQSFSRLLNVVEDAAVQIAIQLFYDDIIFLNALI